MAQGLFNNSQVKRPGEKASIPWPKCSMARVRPDGSGFEVTSTGPNNIWGLSLTGEGEAFIQEANDFGYPLMPFHEFAYYPGGMKALKKTYQPSFPPAAEFRMGGTSLSGLSLLEKGPAVDAKADHTMLVANPIISRVQTLGMHRDGPRWNLKQLPDLVTCDDPFFRPVASPKAQTAASTLSTGTTKSSPTMRFPEITRTATKREAASGGEAEGAWWSARDSRLYRPEERGADCDARESAHRACAPRLADTRGPRRSVDRQGLGSKLNAPDFSDAGRIQALWVLGDSETAARQKLTSSKNRNVRRELARYPSHALTLLDDLDLKSVSPRGQPLAESSLQVPMKSFRNSFPRWNLRFPNRP